MDKLSTIRIGINENDHIERSLKKFKRMCEAFGVSREYRKRKEYRKPSIRLREKHEAAQKRRMKSSAKLARHASKI